MKRISIEKSRGNYGYWIVKTRNYTWSCDASSITAMRKLLREHNENRHHEGLTMIIGKGMKSSKAKQAVKLMKDYYKPEKTTKKRKKKILVTHSKLQAHYKATKQKYHLLSGRVICKEGTELCSIRGIQDTNGSYNQYPTKTDALAHFLIDSLNNGNFEEYYKQYMNC